MNMELLFDREEHAKERLVFIRTYAAWVKRTPNAEWSRQQALLINSFFLKMPGICPCHSGCTWSGWLTGRNGNPALMNEYLDIPQGFGTHARKKRFLEMQ